MEIVCQHCQTRLTIPDDKIPEGKKASFLCPKCRKRIHIDTSETAAIDDFEQDVSEEEFEFFGENATTALICTGPGGADEALNTTLNNLGYFTTNTKIAKKAIASMKYHLFDIIVIFDDFDRNEKGFSRLLDAVSRFDMILRRRTFVMVVSETLRTLDELAAFRLSVNLVVNKNNLNDIEKILVRGINENEKFYAVFNDALVSTGKA
jgi:uncharacterized protein YlaI